MRTRVLLFSLFALAVSPPLSAQPRRLDDGLTERIAAAIRGYVPISIFDDVNACVVDRTVTLQGRVTMPFKRDELAARVAKIDGVRGVENQIRVLPPSNYDSALRKRVAQAIYGHSTFWRYAAMSNPPIHVIVENGRVTLTGRIADQFERTLAGALAHVPGAFGVANELRTDR